MNKTFDYIVIGSGFGGSVASMRLTEKGYSVLTIEKGRRFNPHDFPKTNWDLKNYLWLPKLGFLGFQKINIFKHAFIFSGAGVGGGSLVYCNTLMIPPTEFFKNPQWSDLNDWEKELHPFFDTAGKMLGRTKFNLKNKEDEILENVARDLGKENSFSNVYVGVYFNDDETPQDPYFNGNGPLRTPCSYCAGCMVGCRENAKNSLDKNYLYFAEKKGAEILPETNVWKIEYKNDRYVVHTKRSAGISPKKDQVYYSKGIVVAGGVLGSVKLLMEQKYTYKTLPNLSERIGECVRTNSETLCTATLSNQKLNNSISISSIFKPDENTYVEIAKYPNKSNFMRFLLTLATDKKGSNGLRIYHLAGNVLKHPKLFFRMFLNRNWAENSVIFLVMQTLDNKMNLQLKKWPYRSKLKLVNREKQKVSAYIPIGQEIMHRFAEKANAHAQNSTLEMLFDIPSTAHILGGTPMGKSAEDGVIDKNFQVFNYPDFYVIDGSAMQSNPGVNPSLTITAMAEYAMSKVKERN